MSAKKNKIIILVLIGIAVAISGIFIYTKHIKGAKEDEFTRLMQAGKNYLDQGEAKKAAEIYQKALQLEPENLDAHINIASAYLMLNRPADAIEHCQKAIKIDDKVSAAYYILGCAYMRQSKPLEAIKAFQLSINLDQTVAAAYFHLGRAHFEAGQIDNAIEQLQTAIEMQEDHPSAHYLLGQAFMRAGDKENAERELKIHQQIREKLTNQVADITFLERCKHTTARLPFKPEEPSFKAIPIVFVDDTKKAFAYATTARAPITVIDYNHDGRNSIFALENNGFRLYSNTNGVFYPVGQLLPAVSNAGYKIALVGDIQNDQIEDIIVLGENASQVFRFATNGVAVDATAFCGLRGLKAVDGALADLDFTGALDLVVIEPTNKSIQVFQNLKNFYFKHNTQASGIPPDVTNIARLIIEDINDDELPDLLLSRAEKNPIFLEKRRGGQFFETNLPSYFPLAIIMAIGDFNNDLKNDVVFADSKAGLQVYYAKINKTIRLTDTAYIPNRVITFDYDNDGWLDILAVGKGTRLWRSVGNNGFVEVTQSTGLTKFNDLNITDAYIADFDNDGDSDCIIVLSDGSLRFLRNDGGNANKQLKLRLVGTRSNTSALGVHLEVAAGGLKLTRTVNRLPVEIGVGKHEKIDAVTIAWFDLTLSTVDVKVEPKPVELTEIYFPKGSCPYLYVWNGERFEFVSDFLGNSPLGLRVSPEKFVDADPEEHLLLGTANNVRPRDGFYIVQVTEELSEALYLDEAKLIAVDHPRGTVVHTTSKMRPSKPFPPSELMLLQKPILPIKASRSDGLDVTVALSKVDTKMVSPIKLRVPQLRGLCEPYGITMDFGEIDTSKPLVLVMTGWIKFGGGMANVAASHCPDLPFPFPVLEVQTADGVWHKVDVTVGVPSGKTKTILVDLTGKLPAGARLFRLSMAYELHWDYIALYEKAVLAQAHITTILPHSAHLHWRGYSNFKNLPEYLPLTPDYYSVRPNGYWTIIPSGWCTRYGEVSELILNRDDAFAIVNGGDELTIKFPQDKLSPLKDDYERTFFFYSFGWNKDTDFHVECGTTVEPLPFDGMDYQLYGKQKRPPTKGDALMRKYTTRLVGKPAESIKQAQLKLE